MRQPKLTHKKRKLRLSPNKFQRVAETIQHTQRLAGICIFNKFTLALCTQIKDIFSNMKTSLHIIMKLVWREYYNTYYFICLYFLSI